MARLRACAVAAAALNARLLPRGGPHGNEGAVPEGWPRIGSFWCVASAPLFVVALSLGVVNSVYWSFGVDLISRAGSYSPAMGPVLYAVLGIAGFAGFLTVDAVARFGLRPVRRISSTFRNCRAETWIRTERSCRGTIAY